MAWKGDTAHFCVFAFAYFYSVFWKSRQNRGRLPPVLQRFRPHWTAVGFPDFPEKRAHYPRKNEKHRLFSVLRFHFSRTQWSSPDFCNGAIIACRSRYGQIFCEHHNISVTTQPWDRIGKIWPSPSTPCSVLFGTTRFNSLHVLSDSGQSWIGIQVCPLIFSW